MSSKEVSRAASSVLRGVMEIQSNPPKIVGTLRTFTHPVTKKSVTLAPLPSFASPSYIRSVYAPYSLTERFDKILCEDGVLPLKAGTPRASAQLIWQRVFPFLSIRPVVSEEIGLKHYDGLLIRDRIETRMAFEMLKEQWEPPVDPRARRGVERIATYPDGTKVTVPWNPYHMKGLQHHLERAGFELTTTEEIEVIGPRTVMYFLVFVSGLCLFLSFKFFAFCASFVL